MTFKIKMMPFIFLKIIKKNKKKKGERIQIPEKLCQKDTKRKTLDFCWPLKTIDSIK